MHSAILRQALLSIHLIGLGLGFGGAAVADFIIIKTLKDYTRITPEVVSKIRLISQVIWTGLVLLTISGVALFAQQPSTLLMSAGFIAKMITVAVLLLNGIFLNLYITKRFAVIDFSDPYKQDASSRRTRRLFFISGAISTTSWYSALLIAMFRGVLKWNLGEYISIYLVALVFAVLISLLIERKLQTRQLTV